MKNTQSIIIGIALVMFSVFTNAQTVYTVTKTTDPDPYEHPYNFIDSLCDPEMYGTLQWAIRKVNETYGPRVINFNIPGTEPHTILLNNFLPQITKDVIIDGTSQPGYSDENPVITIDGQDLMAWCFNAYGLNSLGISGFNFIGFIKNGISLGGCQNAIIKSNNIALKNSNYDSYLKKGYFARITAYNCENISLYNNELNTIFEGIPTPGPYNYGIMLTNSTNCNIGSTEQNFSNKIYDCYTGVYLDSCQNIKISANEIYNNENGILLEYGSNNSKKKPMIISYDEGIISGVAEIGDIIEVFGGIGEEDANEFLGTVQADQYGDWTLTATTSYEYLIATATDQNNNTSMFCDEILVSPTCAKPTNLSATEGVSTSHTLTWEGQEGVTYNVAVGIKELSPIYENWIVSYNPNITDNQITVTGLDENTEYEFYVNANCGTEVSHWAGPVVFNVPPVEPTVFTVTKTTDPDPFEHPYNFIDSLCDPEMYGTLQWAVRKTNDTNGPCSIVFSIPGTGPHTIYMNYFLPQITNSVTIDATTQDGYSEDNPAIILNGQYNSFGFYVSQTQIIIKGLHMTDYIECGIYLSNATFCEISDNIINNINNGPRTSLAVGVKIFNCNNITLYDNVINTEISGTIQNNTMFGVRLDNSYDCTIGGQSPSLSNTIYNCGDYGIFLNNSQTIKISGNTIYNNEHAIGLRNGSNNNIQPPEITSYTNGILSGTALPNSTIEVFGSTGPENANEYLVSTIADGNGDWNTIFNVNYPYLTFTQTNNNNTSQLKSTKDLLEPDLGPDIQLCIGHSAIVCDNNTPNVYRTWYSSPQIELQVITPLCVSITLLPTAEPYHEYSVTVCQMWNPDPNYPPGPECASIAIEALPSDPTIYAPDIMCENDPPVTLIAVTEGGNWLGNGVSSSGVFDPAIAEVGTHIIKYFLPNNCGIGSATIIVLSSEELEITPVGPFCIDDDEIQLQVNSSNGVWSGNGITNSETGMFNPSIAGPGPHIITYTTQCSRGTILITVNDYPEIIISGPQDLCFDSPVVNFTTGYSGGTWSGDGITNGSEGSFDPQVAGTGIHTITYTVEAGGCTGIGTYTVNVHALPVAEITAQNPICEGFNLNLSTPPQSGMGTMYYVWNGPNFSASGHSVTLPNISLDDAGLYTVVVSSIFGCSATDNIVITVSPLPEIIEITYDPCINLDNPASFGCTIENADSWQWDFGDGTYSVLQNPTHLFTDFGYHCITLTATNQCGSVSYSPEMPIYVFPSICACDVSAGGDIVYTYTNQRDINPPPIIIDFDEVWYNTSEPYYIEGDIIISPFHTLTIGTDVTVRFAPNGRIIVKERGKLIIKSDAILTSLGGDCDYMWQGIEVHGNSSLPSALNIQGAILMEDKETTIENAHIAILAGERNMDYICNHTGNEDLFVDESNGGIIRMAGFYKHFENCGIGIKLLPKSNNQWNSSANFIGNTIMNSIFNCDVLIDNQYYTFSNNHYPNTYNPWTGNANLLQRTDIGIFINRNDGLLRIRKCDFNNMTYGIESYDAKYNVEKCDFINAYFGIKIFNTNPAIDNHHEISECTFDLIPNTSDIHGSHLLIMGGKYDYIHDNTFGGYDTQQYLNGEGIMLSNSSGFDVIENNFNNLRYGVRIFDSGGLTSEGGFVGAGISSTEDSWKGNRFYQCKTNIFTSGENTKLKLKCNMCDNPDPSIYTTNFNSSGTLANQGSYPFGGIMVPNNKRKFAAGNEFVGLPGLITNPDDELQIYSYKKIISTTDYKYFHHTEPNAAIPVPTSSNITPLSIGLNKVNNTTSCPEPLILLVGPIIDISIPAQPQYPDFNPFTVLGMINEEIENLEFDYNNMILNLDKGNTEQLLNDIYARIPQGKLKNELIYCSPLSDTVLKALIIEYPLSHGNFKNVMQRNLPVSNNVSPYLNERLKTLPNGIVRQILPMMANNPEYITPASIKNTLDFLDLEKQLYINKVVYILTDTILYDKQTALNILQLNNTTESKQVLFGTYLQDGDFINAENILSTIEILDEKTSDWVNLSNILLSLYKQGKTLYDMDSVQLAYVTDLAYKCPGGLGTANARSIIHLLYREDVPECEVMENRSQKMMLKDIEFVLPDSDAYMEDNFPDPFYDKTLINYYLPENTKGKIVVTDIFGRTIRDYELIDGENTLEIENENWAPGIYSYGLFINGIAKEYKKMIITQ